MTYGGSVALIVIGAILRFAISYSPSAVNLQLVGVILMIAGSGCEKCMEPSVLCVASGPGVTVSG